MEAVKNRVETEKESRKIWGTNVMRVGFMQVPSLLLKRQKELGLNAMDMNIILQIASYWWEKDNLPRPSKTTLADALSVDSSTIRKRIAALEKRGYLKRLIRSGHANARLANQYDLNGLIQKLQPYADAELSEREAKKTSKGRRSLRAVRTANV